MIVSDRNIFVGAHVTAGVKYALRQAAWKEQKTMSAFVSEAIREKLLRAGVAEDVLLADPPSPEQTAA